MFQESVGQLGFHAQLLDAVGQAVVATDWEGCIIYWNRAAEELYGWAADEVLGRNIVEVTPAQTSQQQAEAIMARLRAGERWSGEFRVQRKDGSTFLAQVTDVPFYDDAGDLVGIVGVSTDITAQKQSEAEILAVFNSVSEAFVLIDKDYRICTFNRVARQWSREILGRAMQRGDRVLDFIQAADRDSFERHYRQALKGESSVGDKALYGDRGLDYWFVLTYTPAFDDDGEISGMCLSIRDITEQKRAEQAVKKSEERFQLFMEHVPGAVFIKDAEGRLVYANQRFAALAGEEKADLIGRAAEAYTPADLVKKYRKENRRVLSRGQPLTVESTFPDPSGDRRHWMTYKFPIHLDGAPALVGGISLDVTARKEAEAALRQGEALFRGVVQECSDGIAVTDEQGRVVIWNEAQARITGLPSAQVQGRSIVDVLFELTPRAKRDGERLDDLRRVVRAALERGEMPWLNQVVERKLERPDGTYRFVRSVMFTIETQQGFALASTTRDITAHKRVEAALREKQQLLTGVINHSPNIITLMDREGRYLLVNHSTAELLGCSEADLVGKTFAEVLPPETATLFMERLQTVLETQSVLQVEDFMPAPDGERAYNTTLFPLYDDQGDIYAVGGLALDITARVQAEQEVARYAAELERSNQELEQFAYITSHDLREPLRMVKGYLDLLGRRYREELDASAQEFIDYAVDGAERMQEMIRALLRLSRVKTRGEAFAPTDVEAVLARTLNTLRRSIKDAGAEVTHDPLPTLMADGAQLTQVLQNLITNGIKFCREDEPPRVHVSAQREGDEWVFSVADNGIGIDPEQADRLFQIFQRLHTRAEYEGLGIGLVLCRRIVERHGGRIWVESAPGQGATFYFTLPDRGKSAHG